MNPASSRPTWFVLTRHWLSLVGVALITTAGISWLFVSPQQIRGHVSNPYIGIIVFLTLPVVFLLGLALIPIGVYLSKRQIREGLPDTGFERRAALHPVGWFFGVLTLVNLIIGTQVTYRAVEHMETPQFCGATCHSTHPQFAAYQNSPHSRVEGVECHVAPGAAGYFRSERSSSTRLEQHPSFRP